MAAKGKWAQGIPPRNFSWIMKDRLAVSERPGGYGANHRRVRRQEEIIWIREQGFTCVISMIPALHNLHNYDELGVAWRHRGFDNTDEPAGYLSRLYPELQGMLAEGQKILVHADNLGDAVCGMVTGYLVWTGMVPRGPEAVTLTERMVKRQLGPYGRELVRVAAGLSNAAPSAQEAFSAAPRPAKKASGSTKSAPAKAAKSAPKATRKAPKRAAAKKPASRKAGAAKSTATRSTAAKSTATRSTAAKSTATRSTAAKSTAKKAGSKRSTARAATKA